jgi:TolB-like protein
MSRDPEQDYFAEGMAEDIITELSRMRGFFVIARNSSFVYKGRSVSISEVARELGVRYVLEGSVRRAGERVRITAQLIDGDNEAHIWAERYDRKLDDIFELQDEMTRQIVGAIEPSLLTAEAERSHRRLPENLDAWDYVARAMGLVWTWTADDNIAAEELLRKAIQIDSGYARAHSILAVVLTGHLWYGRARKEDRPGDAALRSAQTALELDGGDPWGHMALGFVHGFRREPDDAIAEMEEALSLNPNFALAYGLFGLVLAWAGQTERSLDATDMAERLSPRDVINLQFAAIRGVALFAAADYEAAADQARRGIRKLPLAPGSYRVLATSLGQLGRREDARPVVDRLLELQPGITVAWARENIPVPPSDFLDRYVEGLRLAGIPES